MTDIECLNVEQVMQLLPMKKTFLYTHRAELGGFKIGGAVMFRKKTLLERIEAMERAQIEKPVHRPEIVPERPKRPELVNLKNHVGW